MGTEIRRENQCEGEKKKEIMRMELESLSENEEFARVAVAMFMSRMDPTMEEIDDVKTAVSEAEKKGAAADNTLAAQTVALE